MIKAIYNDFQNDFYLDYSEFRRQLIEKFMLHLMHLEIY